MLHNKMIIIIKTIIRMNKTLKITINNNKKMIKIMIDKSNNNNLFLKGKQRSKSYKDEDNKL